MSACISHEGEYGSHTGSDAPFTCGRCGAFDESAAIEQHARDAARIAELEAECALLRRQMASDNSALVIETENVGRGIALVNEQRARAEAAEAKVAAAMDRVARIPAGSPCSPIADAVFAILDSAALADPKEES